MNEAFFNYKLPPDLIAHRPSPNREESRLMVIHRNSGKIEHRVFKQIITYLGPEDTLVLNNTKVMKARFFGQKKTGAKIEIFILSEHEPNVWKCLIKPAKRVKAGDQIVIGEDLSAVILHKDIEPGHHLVTFQSVKPDLPYILDQYGLTPLPPYIHPPDELDGRFLEERYQTVYARQRGSVAAPTAGLHFSNPLLQAIRTQGTGIEEVTLHVGSGTFQPVAESIDDHVMHAETYHVSRETADHLNDDYKQKKRIVGVGTTSARTLETIFDGQSFQAGSGETRLFIYPGYTFKALGALVTNFHLPRSSLLLLVAAFMGTELAQEAYRTAIQERYRFYSFGDAMLII